MQGEVARGSKLGREKESGVRGSSSLPARYGEPHPARRAGPRAARAARASPRTMGPAPETGRGRGEAEPAPRAASRGQESRAPPPPEPTGRSPSPPPLPPVMGELWARAPGGLGRTPRRTHRGRTAGSREPCERSSGRGDHFLPKPTPPAAAAAAEAAAAAAATPAPESAAAAAPLPLRSPLPLRLEPRPCTASSLGEGHGVAPAAREGRRPREEGGERRAGVPRPGRGGGLAPERGGGCRWGGDGNGGGERKKEVGGVQAGLGGL